VTNNSIPDEPPDSPRDWMVHPDGKDPTVGEQLNLVDAQHDQLVRTQQLATWRAFAAPLAENTGAVVKDPQLVQIAVRILAVFAEQPTQHGLTRAQIHDGIRRLGDDTPPTVLEARLEHLKGMGFLEPYLPKANQERYVVRPAGLAGALAAARVVERGGVDELILLLDRTRAALKLQNPDPARILAHLNSCRYALMVYAVELRRCVDSGTAAELMEASRQHDHSTFTQQVVDLNHLVTDRFAGRHDLEEAGAALIEAEQLYRSAVLAAINKVLAQGGASLNFDVLTPAEYETAAQTAGIDQLAEVGASLVADSPPVYIDVDRFVEVISRYEPRPRVRTRPPEPIAPAQDDDPIDALEAAHAAARFRRRLGLEALLEGAREVALTPHLQSRWSTAAATLADAMALDADPTEPFLLHLAEMLLVDATAPVSYLHPARLIRTDGPLPVSTSTREMGNKINGGNHDR
jgi:hypothetical protein